MCWSVGAGAAMAMSTDARWAAHVAAVDEALGGGIEVPLPLLHTQTIWAVLLQNQNHGMTAIYHI